LSSGIGLALAKKLIYLHKGQILVNSAEGKGSVFTIKVPIGKEHFNPDEIVFDEQNDNVLQVPNPVIVGEDLDEGTVRKKGWKSILVVEDDDEVRSFLVKYFEQEFRTFEATNGKEGLAVAMEHGPDLIISDVMMPEMNGVDLCKQIKNNLNTSHIPVILLTAKTAFSHQREGLEIGADYYITKPFSPEVLSLTIHNLLQSRENLKRFYRNRFINHSEEKAEINSPDEHLLQRIYEVLKKNLANPKFNLDDVSDELGMSRSLLYKKIKSGNAVENKKV
jgi:DNA-binding response OmpR family regulator